MLTNEEIQILIKLAQKSRQNAFLIIKIMPLALQFYLLMVFILVAVILKVLSLA
jgi:hypothetical protein